ncbi:HAD family hydrolase [Kitasatospora acidiphila]|uniref:HAD family hydrolase n=2 Tax=Kitasatospora TaxID=2063 RepID=UPI003C737EEC
MARARWRACPYRELPELARVSSWEALWLDPSAAGLPVAAARWVVEYGRSVWQDAVSAGEASEQFLFLRAELVSPFPEVPETLAELSAHHELWLATEGAGSLQRRKLALSGLADHFARILISAEVGCSKADPAFAKAVRTHLDATGRTLCMVVGDSARTDLALAAHGSWPALHICDPPTCPVSEPGVHHGRGIGEVVRWCECRLFELA